MYGTVSWLNALDEIGKIKKGIDLVCTLFVFKAGIVLLAQERTKGKKKPKVSGILKLISGCRHDFSYLAQSSQ